MPDTAQNQDEEFWPKFLPVWQKVLTVLALPSGIDNPMAGEAADMAVSMLVWGLYHAKDIGLTVQQSDQINPAHITDDRLLLLLAETHFRRGNIGTSLDIIGRVHLEGLNAHPDFLGHYTEVLNQCARAALMLRHTDTSTALKILEKLYVTVPGHIETLNNLIHYHLYTIENLPAAEKIVATLSPAQLEDRTLALMASEYYLRTNNMQRFMPLFAHVNTGEALKDPYKEIHDKQKLSIGIQVGNVASALKEYMVSAATPDILNLRILDFYFDFPYRLPEFAAEAREALAHVALTGEIENAAIAMQFFVSICEYKRLETLFAELLKKDYWANPMLCYAAVTYLPHCANAALKKSLEQKLATQPWRKDGWKFGRAEVEAIELTARFYALSGSHGPAPLRMKPPMPMPPAKADAPKTLFIGLYGQTRYEGLNLPGLRAYLDKVMAPFCRKHNLHLRYGVATWDKMGERTAYMSDGVRFIFRRLPQEFIDICVKAGVDDTASFAGTFPAIMKRFLASPAENIPLHRPELENLFGQMDFVDIASGDAAEKVITTAYESGERHWFNQCRMWDRVAALGRLISECEDTHSETVAAALFLRTDLYIMDGNWDSVLETILAGKDGKTLYMDEDRRASMVEGVGDRYFVAGRDNIPYLTGMWDALLAIAPEIKSKYEPFKWRLSCHATILSYMFQHGADASLLPRTAVNFEIFRGKLTVAQLRSELTSDLATIPEGALRAQLTALLAANPV